MKYPSTKALKCARALIAEVRPERQRGDRAFCKAYLYTVAELIHDHMEPTKGRRAGRIVGESVNFAAVLTTRPMK